MRSTLFLLTILRRRVKIIYIYTHIISIIFLKSRELNQSIKYINCLIITLSYRQHYFFFDYLLSKKILCLCVTYMIHYVQERFCWEKILLDTDLKIILLDHQNNFVETLKKISNAVTNFDILVTCLSILHNYFNNSTKLLFCSVSN